MRQDPLLQCSGHRLPPGPPHFRPQLTAPDRTGRESCPHPRNCAGVTHQPSCRDPQPPSPYAAPADCRSARSELHFPECRSPPELHLPEASAVRSQSARWTFRGSGFAGGGALGCARPNKCWSSRWRTSQQGKSLEFSTILRYGRKALRQKRNVGHLPSSAAAAHHPRSLGCEVRPHVGCGDYLKIKL